MALLAALIGGSSAFAEEIKPTPAQSACIVQCTEDNNICMDVCKNDAACQQVCAAEGSQCMLGCFGQE